MTDEIKKEKIRLSDGGELISVLTVPICENFPKMNNFYLKIQNLCHSYCTQRLPSLLPSSKNTYRYRLSCKAIFDEEDVVTVTLSVTLSDLTNRRQLQKTSETHVWENDNLRKRMKKK